MNFTLVEVKVALSLKS